MKKVQTHGQPAKMAMLCKVGENGCIKDMKAELFDFVSARGVEVDVTRGSLQTIWEEIPNIGPITQGSNSLGRVRKMVMERRPIEKGQVSRTLKEYLEVGRPMTVPLKGPVVVGRPTNEVLNGVRTCENLCDCGRQDEEVFGSQLGSSPLALNFTEITNEALMEKASKYTNCFTCSLFSLGK